MGLTRRFSLEYRQQNHGKRRHEYRQENRWGNLQENPRKHRWQITGGKPATNADGIGGVYLTSFTYLTAAPVTTRREA